MSTIVQRQKSQIAQITKMSEKMRRSYYTNNAERIMNGSNPMMEQESLLLFRSNDQFMEFLKDWYFTKFLVAQFSEPIASIIEKTPIAVSITDSKAAQWENWVNLRIQESDLKQEIKSNLFDIIYYGKFFRLLIPTANETFKLAKIPDSTGVDFAYQMQEHIGYIMDPGADSNFLIKSKAIGSAYGFRDTQYKTIEELDGPIVSILNKSIKLDGLDKVVRNKLVGLETRTPTSVFYEQAGMLFKLYMNELLEWFNGLRETNRQDLLSVTLDATQKDVVEASRVVQSIENVVNQDSSVIYDQSVQTLITRLIGNVLNNTRVLPGVDAYSRAELLKWNDRSEQNAKLTQDTDDLRSRVMAALGVPQELMTQGRSRWDILSTSDRYLSTITTYLDYITDIIKTYTQAVLLNKGIKVDKQQIVFDYKNDVDVQSQLARHKVERIENDVQRFNNILMFTQQAIGTGWIDPKKAVGEVTNTLQDAGVVLAKSFNDENVILDYLMGGRN